MPAYYTTSLLTAVASLCLGAFVFYKNPRNPLHRSLLRLNAVVSLWSILLFSHYISATGQTALLTARLLHMPAAFIPACFLHFILNLLGIYKRKALRLSYLSGGLFLILSNTPYFISAVEPKLYFRFYATAGPLYIFWIIAYLSIAGYGVYLLIINYPRSAVIKKTQIAYVLFASVIGFAGGATIYPLFYNIDLAPFGEHLIFLYPVIFSMAVLKHNLLDLNVVIKHTIVYSVSLLLITLLYLLTVILSERLLRDFVGYRSLWSTIIAVVAIALLFTPLKNRVESIADRIYVKGAYKRFKRELLESDRHKVIADFAAGLAHEIRNPLTAIKTFAEYLPEKFDDERFRKNFSRIVNGEVDRINFLISQLLEFAKPSALNMTATGIHEVIDYTLSLLSGEILKSNINLIKDYAAENDTVNADKNKLKHVLLNIIKNAIESMRDGGTLKVATYRSEGNLKVKISDTGAGIKDKDLERTFEPFFSTKEKGAGLGLAIARGIIEEHGGSISVKSDIGRGSSFIITLQAFP